MNKEYLDYDGLKRYNENLMEVIRRLASEPLPVYWENGTWPDTIGSCRFVAEGYYDSDGIFTANSAGKLFKSINAITWLNVTDLENLAHRWYSVFNCNNRLFVWGTQTDNTVAVAMKYRKDWTITDTEFEYAYIVMMAYGVGKYFAYSSLGDIFTSEDGATWTSTGKKISDSFNGDAGRIVYGAGGGFVAIVSSSTVARSKDGVNWETFTPNIPLDMYSCLEYINGRYYLGGDGGLISSENGQEWKYVLEKNDLSTSADILSIAYANGKWLVVDVSGIAYSVDNQKTWFWHYPRNFNIAHLKRSFVLYINKSFVYLNPINVIYTPG